MIIWQLSNRVSADQYHLTVSPAQVSTHRVRVFFEVIRWQVTSFQTIAGSSLVLLNSWHILCLWAAQLKFFISNWPPTRKFSQLLQAGKTVAFDFPHHGHALITLCAAGLKCRSQVTGHGSDHRPQVRSLVRSQVTHKNYRTLDKTVLDWHFIIQN